MSGSVSMVDGHIDPDKGRMTDKEILKALECCADLFDCISCPCKEFCGDLGKLQQNALDLINCQQAEIERLEKLAKDRADVNFDKIVGVVDRARADIKAEAIKEYIKTCEKTAISNAAKVAKATLLEMVGEDK